MIQFSFCIITDNSIDACERIIHIAKSISELNIPNYEILIIGGEINRFADDMSKYNMRKINFDESVKRAWITKKKNLIVKECKYENIVMMHDYFIFHKYWYSYYNKFFEENDYDVCCNPILLANGARDYTDWIVWDHPSYPRQSTIPYHDWSKTKWQYVSGGYFLVKKQFMIENPFDENLSAGDQEDVEWSKRIREKAKIICNPNSYVRHIKNHRNMTIDTWSKLV